MYVTFISNMRVKYLVSVLQPGETMLFLIPMQHWHSILFLTPCRAADSSVGLLSTEPSSPE